MSTLGRRAMKKTLKNLKRRLKTSVKRYYEVDSDNPLELVDRLHDMLKSLFIYTEALEEYVFELDKAWNEKDKLDIKKIGEMIRKSKEGKSPPKKEEAKKTSYIK